ncbi:MAG TPA: ATP-binding protein [Acidobacteriaceae bacterium]|nr:ATP-binding protein [Acidobacteriaceae bacterium]
MSVLAKIQGKSDGLPNRYLLHAREGFGKTSFAAQTPKPVFIQTRGETGLDTLIQAGQLPETPHFPEISTWDEVLSAVRALRDEPHEYKTLVFDTVNGAERLCYEHVCKRDYAGDWTDKGFSSYMRGYEVAQTDWRGFVALLDELRVSRKMTVFLLVHSKIKQFKNPDGPDYDKWTPDMHDKCWSITHKWADCVLFGNFESTIKVKRGDPGDKGKATGVTHRVMYTQHRAAWDAKNRLGLPEEIDMGTNAQEAWANFVAALKGGKG